MKDDNKAAPVLNGTADYASSNTGVFVNGTKTSNDNEHCEGPKKRLNHRNLLPPTPDPQAHDAFQDDIPTRIQVLTDWANMCTLLGAVLATLSIASMWSRRYYLGMFLNVFASIADIVDGPIARSLPARHPAFSVLGAKLDCYSDIVSHFVVPASLLMSISDLHPCCVILASLYICTGIIRHSYFEVTGRCENGTCIFGVTSDYMVAIYSIVMHLLPVLGSDVMVWVLSIVVVFMMFLCLTFSLRSRRYAGFGLFTVTLFNAILCLSCLGLFLFQAAEDLGSISAAAFVIHLTLAYPCYFRFVEINV